MPGLLKTLGSFGQRILSFVRATGRSIADAISLAPKQAGTPEPAAVAVEYARLSRVEEKAKLLVDLPRDEPIPAYLHGSTDIPFNRPYAYEVTMYGRAVAGRLGAGGVKIGGRFVRDSYVITSNRPLTPEEVIRLAARRFGAEGSVPLLTIYQISVSAAYRREEE